MIELFVTYWLQQKKNMEESFWLTIVSYALGGIFFLWLVAS